MLTTFITYQHDHHCYLCMSISNSISLQKSWHLSSLGSKHSTSLWTKKSQGSNPTCCFTCKAVSFTPVPLQSTAFTWKGLEVHLYLCLAGPTLDGLACETTPPSFPYPFVSFSPFSHCTHLLPDGLLKEMESQAPLLRRPPCQNVAQAPSNYISKRRGVWAPAYVSTEDHFVWIQLQQREHQYQRAKRRRPTAMETQEKKNDRDRNTLNPANSLRVHSFPGGRFPAKFGCQPIKLEWYPTHTRIPRITCACTSGISEYIKRVE